MADLDSKDFNILSTLKLTDRITLTDSENGHQFASMEVATFLEQLTKKLPIATLQENGLMSSAFYSMFCRMYLSKNGALITSKAVKIAEFDIHISPGYYTSSFLITYSAFKASGCFMVRHLKVNDFNTYSIAGFITEPMGGKIIIVEKGPIAEVYLTGTYDSTYTGSFINLSHPTKYVSFISDSTEFNTSDLSGIDIPLNIVSTMRASTFAANAVSRGAIDDKTIDIDPPPANYVPLAQRQPFAENFSTPANEKTQQEFSESKTNPLPETGKEVHKM